MIDDIESALISAAERLRAAAFPVGTVEAFQRLGQQVREPLVLAIVGLVKSGKSTLVNTLLSTDLATVGETETTATINWFRYGRPDPANPVRCYRRGKTEPELCAASFLDELQGDDEEALRRSSDIDRFECLVDCEWLRQIVLVDTPGLGAASSEHQNRTAGFVQLNALLRERHHKETQRLAQEADAIVYVQPPPLHASDRSFLEQYREMVRQGSSAFNAIAVIGKCDEHDDGDLEQSQRRALNLARQLGSSVKSVIPVSAGVHQFVQRLRHNPVDCQDLFRFARETSEDEFSDLTDMPGYFVSGEVDVEHCPLDSQRRAELASEVPWMAFRATALYIRKNSSRDESEILANLERLAGIRMLQNEINRSFVERGTTLRCLRIVQDAEAILENAGYELAESRRTAERDARALERKYHSVLFKLAPAALPQDAATVEEILRFVTLHAYRWPELDKAQASIATLVPQFAALRRSLEGDSVSLGALQLMSDLQTELSEAEKTELGFLFGGADEMSETGFEGMGSREFLRSRQVYWQERSRQAGLDSLQRIADAAVKRYGEVLWNLVKPQET